ncbi:MAG: putative DNA binding domain-containing protein [Prevotellaceae bacterium]|nr:putative DNA binding domain-containing protein [Prevotellaceae bacterium]
MTTTDIKDLMLYGERINIEYKEAGNDLPKSLWETYSAFANTIGGIIVLGIKEHRNRYDKNRFEIKGVKDTDKILKSFWDTINSDKVSRNILFDNDVECVEYEDKTLITINVPMANYTVRPIYINKNLLSGSFKRNYEGDYHCTEEEAKAMLRDANENGNDGLMLNNYDMNDIDLPTLHAYRNHFKIRNIDHIFNQLDDKEFLRNMGGYTTDRVTRREGLTMAGLMMFGKGLSVRERFDNIRMDYIDKTNLIGDSRWSDRLTYDGTWENNLFNFFTRTIPKLTADLKRPFKLKGIERIDDTPIHKAIREGMTNMIIHADLFITGVLKVEKYDHEFLFSNPGSLKLPIEDIMKGGNSKARNPRIQNMLRMIGYGDNIGSGYPTILKTWKDENWRKPTLLDRTELKQVDLTMPMISLLPKNVLDEMKTYYGNEAYHAFTSEEQMIMAYVWNGESISNTELQQLLGINSIEAGKILHQMVDKQLLNKENKSRWTTYTLLKEYNTNSTSEEKSDKKSDKKNSFTLTAVENKILTILRQDPNVTYQSLEQRLTLGKTTLYKAVHHLKELNIVRREGGRKNGSWVINIELNNIQET